MREIYEIGNVNETALTGTFRFVCMIASSVEENIKLPDPLAAANVVRTSSWSGLDVSNVLMAEFMSSHLEKASRH